MRYMRFVWIVGASLGLILTSVTPAPAQEATGVVMGTVVDPQKAAVPAATVLVTNTNTGVVSLGKTGSNGHFEVHNLAIGSYTVTVTRAGFQKVTTQAQALQIDQTLHFTITLPLGSMAQSVTVEAEVSQLQTRNATIGATVTGAAIQDLPLNGRNTLDLAQLQPGVVTANPAVGGISVAGGRPDSITYILDGSMNNDLLANNVVFNPNPDTVGEFRLLTSDYTAKYGRNAAGVIVEAVKQGTNTVHGSAYDYVRNGDLNANDFFRNLDGLPRDQLKRNQFGGTIGGPITIPGIVHGANKLFFFIGYQGQRQTDQELQSQTPTFTPLELQGNFSQADNGAPDPNVAAFLQANPYFQANPGLAAQGIIDPTTFDTTAGQMIKDGLIPTDPTGFINAVGNDADNNNQIVSRVDYDPGVNDRFTLTAGGTRESTLSPFANADVAGYPDITTDNTYLTGLSYTHTFSVNLSNEAHFGVQRDNRLQDTPGTNLPNAAALGIGITPDLPIGPPVFQFDTGLTTGFSIQGPSALIGTTWEYSDALTWVHGNNTWGMGGGFSAYQQNMAFDFLGNGDFYYQGTSASTGNSYADFLLGIPNFFEEGPNAPSDVRQKTSYLYLQDDWRTTPDLTLSLGLRYSYSSPKSDTQGREFGLIPGLQSTVFPNAPLGLLFPGDQGEPTGSNFPDKDNFAPRLGFAENLGGHGTTIVRGGAGVFYDVLKAEDNFQFNGQPPFAASANFGFPNVGPGQSGPVGFMENPYAAGGIPNPFPSKPVNHELEFTTAGFIPFAPPGGVYVNPHIYTPYIYQYNLSVEHKLGTGYTAEINYVGSSSHGLTGLVDEDPFVLGTTNRLLNAKAQAANPTIAAFCSGYAGQQGIGLDADCPYGIMDDFDNVGSATYNSLQAAISKRVDPDPFFGQMYFTLAYTYGHSIDNSSGYRNNTSTVPYYDRNAFRGPSDFDVTHRISFAGSWTLPFAAYFPHVAKSVTQGWMLDPILTWQTGFPLTPSAGLNQGGNPAIPGPSGAGDSFLADAALAPGVTTPIPTENPKNAVVVNGAAQNEYFDPNLFTSNLTGTDPYGAPRGILRGPGLTNLDLAVVKHTQINERMAVEIRGEAFNIFNDVEFNNPSTNIDSANFGMITSDKDPRIVQLALRLTF
ncbi:MAG: carboxypeptidase regulatory-like domain-containing protein [Terriglobales bacterium]